MPKVVGYHRPSSIAQALELLSQPGAAVLAGGTVLNADRDGDPVVAIDIQSLDLGRMESLEDGRVRLGASMTLQQLADAAEMVPVLADLARRETSSSLRTLATVGGSVSAASPSSHLLAGLLVHDAVVSVQQTGGGVDLPLADVLADRAVLARSLITHVTVSIDGRSAVDRTGRTPGDEPIVAAAARRGADGRLRLALCGVAATPILVDDPAGLSPPGDFRGSSEYRRHVATVLAQRVRQAVGA